VTDSTGVIEPEGVSGGGDGVEVGVSCAETVAMAMHATAIRNPQFAIRNSNIVPPVYVGENVVPRFALAQKLFIDTV
jgi:hypothetical protein